MKSTRGHAAQASGKHAVHLEVDGPGATPRAAPCLSFSFARLWHFIFILILFDLIRTLSAVSAFVRRAPEHGPSGWPPYRRSLVGRALLPLLLSPTMFDAATSSPRAPDVLLVFLPLVRSPFTFISCWSHLIVLHKLLLRPWTIRCAHVQA